MRLIPIVAVALAAPPALAVSLDAVSLPSSEPSGASLLAVPSELATLQARRTQDPWRVQFQAAKSLVDGRLATLSSNPASLGDDTLSKLAKAAGLLHFLGETPPNTLATYADAASRALRAIGSRDPGNPVFPPSNAIDVLQDSSRLQSMCEGYDFVRGAVPSGEDSTIRNVLADWSDALKNDLNLTGALGVSGHRDNWGIKAGAVLVECALAMPTHRNASGWLSFGRHLLDESLAKVSDDKGWYRESPHYLNYALANLFGAAIAVKHRTGVDWFDDLAAFARLAFDMRQPDGWSAPFEEGVSTTFPFDVFAAQVPAQTGVFQWAWAHSPKDASNFENQAFQAVTRFVALTDAAAEEPAAPFTRFADGPAHVHVLRSGFGPDATQLTAITAIDHANTTTFDSRHNLQNPLDFTLYSHGQRVVVTSGGGPTVTTSANRSEYLKPSSRNVPLLGGTAPFLTDPSKIRSDDRLDSDRADFARTVVTGYPNATVTRTWLLLDDSEAFVADAVQVNASVAIALPFHSAGTRAVSANGALASGTWTSGTVVLDFHASTAPAATLANTSSFTSPTWNVEEAVQGIELRTTGTALRSLVRLAPRAAAEAAATVTSLTAGPALHVARANGGFDVVLAGSVDDAQYVFRGDLGVVRADASGLVGVAAAGATSIRIGGEELVSATTPATFSVTRTEAGLRLVTGRDGDTSFSLRGFLPLSGWTVTTGRQEWLAQDGLTLRFVNVPPGSTLELGPGSAPVLDDAAPATLDEGTEFSWAPHATDPDGTTPRLTIATLPAGATFDGTTLRWTPAFDTATRAGDVEVRVLVTATDGYFTDTTERVLTVRNVNRPPVLAPDAIATVVAGDTLERELYATDPDGDPLTATVTELQEITPDPVILTSPIRISWTPDASNPGGSFGVTVTVSDGLASAEATMSLKVTPLPVDPDVDAGTPDPSDAGDDTPVPGGCGCGGADLTWLLVLSATAARRRARARPAPPAPR